MTTTYNCDEEGCDARVELDRQEDESIHADTDDEWEFIMHINSDGVLIVSEVYCEEHTVSDSLDDIYEKVEEMNDRIGRTMRAYENQK